MRDQESQGWTPAEVAKRLKVPQPRVSELLTGKIHLVSLDKLFGYLAAVGVTVAPSFEPGRARPFRFDVKHRPGSR